MLTKVADLRERNVTEIKLERQNWGKCLDMMSGHADRFRHSNEVYKALKNKTKQKKPGILLRRKSSFKNQGLNLGQGTYSGAMEPDQTQLLGL